MNHHHHQKQPGIFDIAITVGVILALAGLAWLLAP